MHHTAVALRHEYHGIRVLHFDAVTLVIVNVGLILAGVLLVGGLVALVLEIVPGGDILRSRLELRAHLIAIFLDDIRVSRLFLVLSLILLPCHPFAGVILGDLGDIILEEGFHADGRIVLIGLLGILAVGVVKLAELFLCLRFELRLLLRGELKAVLLSLMQNDYILGERIDEPILKALQGALALQRIVAGALHIRQIAVVQSSVDGVGDLLVPYRKYSRGRIYGLGRDEITPALGILVLPVELAGGERKYAQKYREREAQISLHENKLRIKGKAFVVL